MHGAFELSGEPPSSQIAPLCGSGRREQADATKIAATNVTKREYQKEYMEYWNSTETLTGTGRPVDAVIMPVAPFAAARRQTFQYYGYTSIINILDYPACVIPITNVDPKLDVVDTKFKPLGTQDEEISRICKIYPSIYVEATDKTLQMIQRRIMVRMCLYSLLAADCKRRKSWLWRIISVMLWLDPDVDFSGGLRYCP